MTNNKSRRNFIKRSTAATAGLTFGMSALEAAHLVEGRNKRNIKWKRNGRLISLNLPYSGDLSSVEVRLFSKANDFIFEYDDVSPYAPKVNNEQTRDVWMPGYDEQAEIRKQSSREQRFPVVDLALNKGMEVVIEFNVKEPGEYNFNENGYRSITEEVRLPKEQVEHWGNSLYLDPKTNSIQHFYLSSQVDVIDGKVSFEFETLRDDWVGAISVVNADTKELIANTTVSWDVKLPEISTGTGISRERMIA